MGEEGVSDFTKTFGDGLDVIDIQSESYPDWLTIQMAVGNSGNTVTMTLLTTEMVADLHHALSRYLLWRGK